jgi:hypothetical protein
LFEEDVVDVQFKKELLDERTAAKVATVNNVVTIIVWSAAAELGVDRACSPGNAYELHWTSDFLSSIKHNGGEGKIGELCQVKDLFTIIVPFKVSEIGLITESNLAQAGADGWLNILGHRLEVVDVSLIIVAPENLMELTSSLLREVERVNLGIDEYARCQIVRIIEEGVVLQGFCTTLGENRISLHTATKAILLRIRESDSVLVRNKKAYLTANMQQDGGRGGRDGVVDVLAILELNNARTRHMQLPYLEFEFVGETREGVELGQRFRSRIRDGWCI